MQEPPLTWIDASARYRWCNGVPGHATIYILEAFPLTFVLCFPLMTLESEGLGKLSATSSIVRHALDAIAYHRLAKRLVSVQCPGRFGNDRQFLNRVADGPKTRGRNL